MKKLAPLLMILALLGGAWYVYTNYMGGSGSVSAPTTGVPDVDLPGPGEAVGDAAEGAETGAKKAADEIAGLPETFWTTVVPVALLAGAVWWLWRDSKRRTAALIVALIALLLVAMGQLG